MAIISSEPAKDPRSHAPEAESTRRPAVGTVRKSRDTRSPTWFARNVRQVCDAESLVQYSRKRRRCHRRTVSGVTQDGKDDTDRRASRPERDGWPVPTAGTGIARVTNQVA
jgi:hypothetical protein